jgi:hypothetical protein
MHELLKHIFFGQNKEASVELNKNRTVDQASD